MAATYVDSYTLSEDVPFRQKLRIASMLVVNDKINDPDDKVKAFNRRVVHDWAANEEVVAVAVSANPSITSASSDAQLKTALTGIWPTLAGLFF